MSCSYSMIVIIKLKPIMYGDLNQITNLVTEGRVEPLLLWIVDIAFFIINLNRTTLNFLAIFVFILFYILCITQYYICLDSLNYIVKWLCITNCMSYFWVVLCKIKVLWQTSTQQ